MNRSYETGIFRSGTSNGSTGSAGLRIGSLFSGIGGLELGLEQAGVGSTVYQVEVDALCRRELARHWLGVPQWSDITEVDPATLPPADVVCGGFPCQDISIANAKGNVTGSRAGLQGARSGLWSYMAAVVEAQKPTWVVVENVARGWKHWLPTVRGELGRQGYTTIPVPLEARVVGAPHVRSRIFLLAHSDGFALRQHEQRLPGGRADGLRDGGQAVPVEHGSHGGWQAEPCLSVVDDGLPRGMGGRFYRAVGNAVVPQCGEVIGHMIRELINAGAKAR